MAKNKAEYKHVGDHVSDLADGQMVGPGDVIELSDEEVREPHNESLITAGTLIPVNEAAEHEAQLAQRRDRSREVGKGEEG